MLGRLRKTTRIDAGLALVFAGMAYLVWALVAGISRRMVQDMIESTAVQNIHLPPWTNTVKVFFVDSGFAIDLVGVGWLIMSLVLVVFSSRQRISVSWAWVSAMCQSFAAAIGSVLVGWAVYQPYVLTPDKAVMAQSIGQRVSSISLQVMVPVAIVVWVTVLVWLLVERARLNRRGPTLRDGMRSNIYP